MNLAAALLFATLLPAGPDTQDNEDVWDEKVCTRYSIEQLDDGVIPLNAKAYVDVKYDAYLRRIVALRVQAKLIPKGIDASIIRRLRSGDNIRIFGRFTGPTGKPGDFYIHRIKSLPSDEEEYATRRNRIDGDDVKGLLELADWAMARYTAYDVHVEPLRDHAILLYNKVVQLLEDKAGKDDFDAHLEIAKIIQERIGDRGRALDKLKETCLRIRPDDPDLERYIREEVGGVWYRGDWVKYEDFKTAEGFLPRSDGTWVRAAIFHLEAFVGRGPKSFAGTVPDAQARGGTVQKGLKPYQMIWAKRSYPEYILRMGAKAEVWVYPDAYYLFWEDKYHEKKTRNPQ